MRDPVDKVMRDPVDDGALAQLLRAAGPRTEVPLAGYQAAHRAVLTSWQRSVEARRRRRRYLQVSLAAAATMLLAVAAVFWRDFRPQIAVPLGVLVQSFGTVQVSQGSKVDSRQALVEGAVIQTATQSGARVWLHQGQELRIDAGTRVQLDKNGALKLLHGRLYATASRGQQNPLRIETPWGAVADVGTRFEVETGEHGLGVRVRDGRVRVMPKRGSATEIGGGTAVTVTPQGAVSRRSIAPYGPEWDWTLGLAAMFDIDGHSLAEFLEWIAAEMGWRLEYAGPRAAQSAREHVLHGSTADLSPEETLRVVMRSSGVPYRLHDGVLRVGVED